MAVDWGLVLGAVSAAAVPIGFGIGVVAMANLIPRRICDYAEEDLLYRRRNRAQLAHSHGYLTKCLLASQKSSRLGR